LDFSLRGLFQVRIDGQMTADMSGTIDAAGTTIGFTGQQRSAMSMVKK
jgi:hypothetical protein